MEGSEAIGEYGLCKFPFGDRNDRAVAVQFRLERPLSQGGDSVIDAAFVIHFRIDLSGTLTNQPCLDHASNRPVKGTRPHLHPALGIGFDLFHDAVAVPFFTREREQNMKHCGSQRRVWCISGHGSFLYPLRIYVNDSVQIEVRHNK